MTLGQLCVADAQDAVFSMARDALFIGVPQQATCPRRMTVAQFERFLNNVCFWWKKTADGYLVYGVSVRDD